MQFLIVTLRKQKVFGRFVFYNCLQSEFFCFSNIFSLTKVWSSFRSYLEPKGCKDAHLCNGPSYGVIHFISLLTIQKLVI